MKFTPAASTRISTSPLWGDGVGTSSTCRASGPPVARTRMAFTPRASQVDALHPRLGVAQSGRRVARNRAIDAAQLLGGEAHVHRPGILLDVTAPLRPGDRHDVRALGQHPGESELRGGALFLLGHLLDSVGQRQVVRKILALKARVVAAVVVGGEVLGLFEPAAQESAPQRAVGDEPDAELAAGREDVVLGVARPERVLRLQPGNRTRRMRLSDGGGSGVGETAAAYI